MKKSFFRTVIMFAVATLTLASCKDEAMAPETPVATTSGSSTLTDAQKAAEAAGAAADFLKKNGALTPYTANATASVPCDGVKTHLKSHLPIRFINTKILTNPDVIKNISGGRVLKGVSQTSPEVEKGEDVLASGKFWEGFTCEMYAIFPTLVWTVDPAQSGATYATYYAGYAPTATHTVAFVLLVTKEDVYLQCHEIDNINGQQKSYDFAFSLVFAYETGTGTGTGVVTPPVVTPPTSTLGFIIFDGKRIYFNEKLINPSDRPKDSEALVAFNYGQEILKEAARATNGALVYAYPNGSFGKGLSANDWYGYNAYLKSGLREAIVGGKLDWKEETPSTTNIKRTWKATYNGYAIYFHITSGSETYQALDPTASPEPGKNFFLLEIGAPDGSKTSGGSWPLQ